MLSEIKKMSEKELATAINTGHRQINEQIHTARRHASAALVGALRAGAYLLEVHGRFGRSGWGSWLKKHCSKLPISSAYRYMDLAKKFPRVRNPEKIPNLRQAYLECGILPEAPEKTEKTPDLTKAPAFTETDLVAGVKSMRQFVAAQLNGFDTAEPSVRHELMKEITALQCELQDFMQRISAEEREAPRLKDKQSEVK